MGLFSGLRVSAGEGARQIPGQHTMIILWLLTGLLVFAVFTVTYWIRYYHTVITAALKIENIKKSIR